MLDRTFVTFRLFPEERDLLRNLGRGPEPASKRHNALLDLVEIVEEIDLPDIRNRERRPIRLGIPRELDVALRKVSEKTGQTYMDILVAAAREYRRRYPFKEESTER